MSVELPFYLEAETPLDEALRASQGNFDHLMSSVTDVDTRVEDVRQRTDDGIEELSERIDSLLDDGLEIQGPLTLGDAATADNRIELRGTGGAATPTPPAGVAYIYYNETGGVNGLLRGKNSTSTQTLATF